MGGLLMGADIHSMAEVKRPRHEGPGWNSGDPVPGMPWVPGAGEERWVPIDTDPGIFTNTYYDPESTYAPFRSRYRSAPLDDRNYTLFALLADVRNGRGFAGIPTGDRIQPLAEPRGVPSDASYAWLAEVDSWDVDMHSHTWFTLAELTDNALYGQRLVRTGVIPGPDYEKFRDGGGKPESWSGSISGPGILTVTPQEYDAGKRADPFTEEEIALLHDSWFATPLRESETYEQKLARFERYIAETRTYVQYVWEDSLVEAIGELTDAIEALKRYAADLPPKGYLDHEDKPVPDEPGWYGHGVIPYENIRIVMGFDN